MASLDAPLKNVVGGGTAKALETLDLHTVRDLLRHYPRRYAQRGELTKLSDLERGEHVTIFAEVRDVRSRRIRSNLSKTDVRVSDGTESITLTFFNQPWRDKQMPPGSKAYFSGKADKFKNTWQLTNPEVHLVGDDAISDEEFAGSLLPVYSAGTKISTFAIQR
ncbi:MAG: OB-fold nucleic acid binding domain-containing protein, partial [Acidothermaceae bacterium]